VTIAAVVRDKRAASFVADKDDFTVSDEGQAAGRSSNSKGTPNFPNGHPTFQQYRGPFFFHRGTGQGGQHAAPRPVHCRGVVRWETLLGPFAFNCPQHSEWVGGIRWRDGVFFGGGGTPTRLADRPRQFHERFFFRQFAAGAMKTEVEGWGGKPSAYDADRARGGGSYRRGASNTAEGRTLQFFAGVTNGWGTGASVKKLEEAPTRRRRV
jgi:hypothetical protein